MFDEMRFLFDNSSTVYNYKLNDTSIMKGIGYKDISIVLPTRSNIDAVKNYIVSNVNKSYSNTKVNPYTKLLQDFPADGKHLSTQILPSDLVYLRDIGVLPLNRLFILRRFPEGCYVPNDLTDINIRPIATIIGWMKDDKEFLKYGFSEKWIQQGSDKMLYKLITDILSNEFDINLNQIIPVPGWGLGFMFELMKKMGFGDLDVSQIVGNPNLLQESLTRDGENFGLNSSFNFNLETCYEQKLINGIDPTFVVKDIIGNLLTMGTSNVYYMGSGRSKIIQDLVNANSNPKNGGPWLKLISDFITAFNVAISGAAKNALTSLNSLKTKSTGQSSSTDANAATQQKMTDTGNSFTKIQSVFNANSPLIQTILASTVGRYKWPYVDQLQCLLVIHQHLGI